jgi:RND family efflux transporter MFP subunit
VKSRRPFYVLAAAAIVVAVVALLALRLARPVAAVAVVKRGTAVSALPATVSVRADYSMELRSESGGRVIDSSLVLGRRVKAGELLLKIDDADMKLELERVTNDYNAALKRRDVGSATKLDLETSKADLANFTRLSEGGQYSSTELDKRKREVRALEQKLEIEKIDEEARITGLATDIKTRRRQIEKTSLFAPIDADVTAVSAYVGDLIVSSAPLATLLARERLVEARVSEENFSGVVLGQRAQVRFLGYGEEQFAGTVARVLPTADPLTQRYTVILDVTIPPARLVPGLSGEASIIVGQRADVLIIPRRALLGDYVLAVDDGRVKQRRVTRGYESLNEVEIVSGLKEGDLVITDNLDAYRENDRVRVARP